MIPPDEQERLADCVREAWELAEQGQVLQGYGVLKLGLVWAETPAIHPVTFEQSPREPWAGALADRYRAELVRYVAAFHHVLGSSCLAAHADSLREETGVGGASAGAGSGPGARERLANVAQQLRTVRERGVVH